MKLKRIEAGFYRSECGRVEINRSEHREPIHGTNRTRKEVQWELTVDGHTAPMVYDKMKEAANAASKRLLEIDGKNTKILARVPVEVKEEE